MALDMSRFLARFVEEGRENLHRLTEGIGELAKDPTDKERVNTIFRAAHTLKGSSRMLKLLVISDTAHQLEEVLGSLREDRLVFTPDLGRLLMRGVDLLFSLVDCVEAGAELPPPDEALFAALHEAMRGDTPPSPSLVPPVSPPEPLPNPPKEVITSLKTPETVRVKLAKLDEMIKLMGEVILSNELIKQIFFDARHLERRIGELSLTELSHAWHTMILSLRDHVLMQEQLMLALNDKALLLRMLPLSTVLEPSAHLVRELARSLGKEVECEVMGGEIELDRQIIDRLGDPLVHLLRNAVDHGIEEPEERRAAGKAAYGRLQLQVRQEGAWVLVHIVDDGRGLPLERIRAKAVQRGIVPEGQAVLLTEAQLAEMIFLPGFSTSPIITDISGRGAGMDVVKKTIVDDLQGMVQVQSQSGQGCSFTIRLPLSLAMMRVLICEVQGQLLGFTAQYVVHLLRVQSEDLLQISGGQAVVVHNEFIPVVALGHLLTLPVPTSPISSSSFGLLLVVVQVQQEKIALIVDQLLDERDMVIKPLPLHMRHNPLVVGMVVTGHHSLVNLLHLPALLVLARKIRYVETDQESRSIKARILVVDDSINTREIEKEVLQAHGYQVILAEDGLEGLELALTGEFDAILTDVEMPRMDGFSMTARLRQEEHLKNTPIIIITSRAKEEDKRRGIEVGADAYIVKSDFEQHNLLDILRNLLG
ncbi:MAG: response regulator [Magnetococcus sp. DMHC-6]